jgi:hypothetical protein
MGLYIAKAGSVRDTFSRKCNEPMLVQMISDPDALANVLHCIVVVMAD